MTNMVRVVNFENNNAENIVSRVVEEAKKINEQSEMKDVSHETIVKESLKSIAQSVLPQSTSSQVLKDDDNKKKTDNDSVFPSYFEKDVNNDITKKIEMLVDIAFNENLDKAINLSKKEPFFVEDAFHDALTEKLIPELKKREVFK